jgi:hypothetical protein
VRIDRGGVDYAFEVISNGKTVEQAIEMTRTAARRASSAWRRGRAGD